MLKLAFLFFLSGAVAVFAQEGRGTIEGTVTDPSGAPVPAAKVSITNSETNVSIVTQTNGQGYYSSPALVVGTYQVAVEQQGFDREVHTDIRLQVDQRAEADFSLKLGQVGQSVVVTGDVPLVNTSDATVGQVIENKRVEELPINGRSAFALIGLAANVKSNAGPTQSGFADRGTNLSAFSINGGPTATNYFLVDGMVAIQSYYPDLNADLAVDAVQEFKVQSGTMSAQYGLTAGGVINVATKSGTNQPHGSLYEFVRNNDFDSRNTFASSVAPFHYNQYGLALGAPVIIPKLYNGRNKTFIFGNWEQWNYSMASFPITSVPTGAQRAGDFSQTFDASGRQVPIYDPATTVPNPAGSGFVRGVFPGNVIPTNRLDPVSVNILAFYPLPNRTPTNAFTNANNYIGDVTNTRRMQQYTIRVDQHFSDTDSMFARYTYFHHFDDNGAQSPWPSPVVRDRNDNFETRNSVVSETHIFSPSVVNEVLIGTARQYFPFQVDSFGGGWPQKLGLPASVPPTAFPNVNNGLTGFPTQTVGLRGALTWQFDDHVTIVRGSHNITTGLEYRLLFGNNYQTSSPSGTYNFAQGLTGNPQLQTGTGSSFATFMLGDVSSASVTTHIGESEKGYAFAGFIQDDWRTTKNLTLNLGLRYDYQAPPYERNNGLSNFFPGVIDSVNGLRGAVVYEGIGFHGGTFNPDYTNFGPRFGFAYDVGGHGKTVIRGGYSIYYPDIFNVQYFGSTNGFSTTTTNYNPPGNNTNLPAFLFHNGLPSPPVQPQGSALGPAAFLGQAVTIDQRNQRTPMSQQWDFDIQRQLPGEWIIDIGYAGNHGTHLVSGNYDLNQLTPQQYATLKTTLQSTVPNPYAGIVPGALGAARITLQQSLAAFPYYTSVSVRNPHMGNSIYHAGLIRVEKRFSQGLTFLASYTKGKLIDDSVASPITFGNVEQVSTVSYQNGLYNRRAERSLDPTDVSQRLVLSGVYEIPVGKGKKVNISSGLLNAVIGGWQLDSIATMQTGVPVAVSGANNNLATRPNSTGRSAKLSNPTAAEWFNTSVFVNPPSYIYGNLGRVLPDVRNPGIVQIDLSVIKNWRIKERGNLQFRAESFNVVNHVNLGLVSGSFSPGPNGLNTSGTFGTITSARMPRNIQLGMKLTF
ncbi:MAG TPA: carboxypeptidase regulatory-like domain-containing protein [Bryobacteraceae bacterium]|nr:carboxypeptidase regulatory-like domain-containing protein [Bryobacteraceae bacterium]